MRLTLPWPLRRFLLGALLCSVTMATAASGAEFVVDAAQATDPSGNVYRTLDELASSGALSSGDTVILCNDDSSLTSALKVAVHFRSNDPEVSRTISGSPNYLYNFQGMPLRPGSQTRPDISGVLDENGVAVLTMDSIILDGMALTTTNTSSKLGIWVRDDTQGIGTLTYVTKDGNFGALGHGISDIDTGNLLSIKGGNLYCAQILGVQKGEKGSPGELSGLIRYRNDNVIGQIRVNSSNGIYGSFTSSSGNNITELQTAASASKDTGNASESFNQSKTSFWDFADSFSGNDSLPISLRQMKIGYKQEVQTGPASILCDVGNGVKEYDAEITRIDMNHEDTNKSFVIHITDQRLLNTTGGIVQGMSGSPILQNGKVIGAVTHVFVQDAASGYGIFIENMLERV